MGESMAWFCLFYFPCGISLFVLGQFWSPGIKGSNLRGSGFPKGLRATLPQNCSKPERLPNKVAIRSAVAFFNELWHD